MAGHKKFSSGALGVLGEEHNKEAGSDDHWNVKHKEDNWEVPVNVVVKDQEVVHGDQVDSEEDGEDTDGDNSALNWETGAAG